MYRRTLPLVVVSLAILAACGGARSPAPEPGLGPLDDEAARAEDPPPPASSGGELELLDDGAEPRFALAYRAPVGTRQGMEMASDVTLDLPQIGTMTMPTTVLTANIEVVSVDDDGSITSELVLTGADVRDTESMLPGAADQLRAELVGIEGQSTTVTISRHGRELGVERNESASDPAHVHSSRQVLRSFNQMIVWLPEQAVGIGARWRVDKLVDHADFSVEHSAVFELIEVSDGRARIKGVATMTAAPQDLERDGMDMRLDRLTGEAVTDLTIDFSTMVPTLTDTVTMDMTVTAMGQTTQTVMTMTTRTHVP